MAASWPMTSYASSSSVSPNPLPPYSPIWSTYVSEKKAVYRCLYVFGSHRFSIKGRVYPAIVPVQNKSVSGQVLLDVTDAELAVLDAFEDVEYERQLVEVTLTGGQSEKLHAYTYVWGNKNDPDLYGEWDFEEWKKNHIIDFLKMSKDFVEELGQPDSQSRIAMFFEERRYGK